MVAAFLRSADGRFIIKEMLQSLFIPIQNLPSIARTADILVVAVVSLPAPLPRDIKPGAIVLDIGTNRLPDGRLVGDVDFDTLAKEPADNAGSRRTWANDDCDALQNTLEATYEQKIYSVSELGFYQKYLEQNAVLSNLWVRGEMNFKNIVPTSLFFFEGPKQRYAGGHV